MQKQSEVTSTMPPESPLLQIQTQGELPNTADIGDASDQWEELRKEVVHGFLYSHTRANDNTGKTLEVASFAYALIERLQEKGVITIEALGA